jgi:DNA (cytosine-5)-methyltransferase 1
MTHIDLFSGIGGFALAAERAGFKTEVFCENDQYCRRLLKLRFPGVPIIKEIREFDGTKWRGATVLTGGFPCQPFSQAGKRRGQADDRYLWPEMFAVIKDARPRWVIGENVVGIYRMALDQVLTDLEGEGYTARTFIIPAAGINAPHKRARVWIIAHSGCKRPAKFQFQTAGGKQCCGYASHSELKRPIQREPKKRTRPREGLFKGGDSHATDSESGDAGKQETGNRGEGISGGNKEVNLDSDNTETARFGRNSGEVLRIAKPEGFNHNGWQESWYEAAARFCGMDDGVSNRVDRLKALGNAVVPQIPEVIMRGIKEIEG